jgi:hypothetical protein
VVISAHCGTTCEGEGTIPTSKKVKLEKNLAESSKGVCSSKSAVLMMMMMMYYSEV